ncbi:TetR/AcrR family transcriptional regulator [Nocardia grenadensis]
MSILQRPRSADYSHSRGREPITPTDRFQPRKQPKQQRAAQTRQWILDAAAHVFSEYGYAAGTTNRIADRAGVSIGSLYQYFPNKDSILHALMDAHFEAGSRLLTERLAAGVPPGLEDLLRLFIRATIDNHREDPRLHRVLFEEAPRAPQLLARLHEAEEFAVAAAAQLLAKHPDVVAADTTLSARIVVATVESLVHRLVTAPDPVPPGKLEDEMVALLTGYLTNTTS